MMALGSNGPAFVPRAGLGEVKALLMMEEARRIQKAANPEVKLIAYQHRRDRT